MKIKTQLGTLQMRIDKKVSNYDQEIPHSHTTDKPFLSYLKYLQYLQYILELIGMVINAVSH